MIIKRLSTSQVKQLDRHLKLVSIHYGDDPNLVKSDFVIQVSEISEQEIDCIVLKMCTRFLASLKVHSQKLQSVMLELVLHIKKKILIDKLNCLMIDSQLPKCFKTSDLVSIRAKALQNFVL